MKRDGSMTLKRENTLNLSFKEQWEKINWEKAEIVVNRLQIRIAKATKEGKWNLVKRLQYLLTHSFYAKALAIKGVTQNKGKRTAGIDGIRWLSASAKMKALLSLTDKKYKANPLKRIFIPKPGKKEKRPLSIPTMYDRAMQALYAMALIPVAETTADSTSFGFRRHRSTHDACEYAFKVLSSRYKAEYILESDIKGCFNNISHEWLNEFIPMDKSVLKQFLKCGFIFNRHLFPTDKGTPQGGIISPILANMTLDGIEEMIGKEFWISPAGAINKSQYNPYKVNLVRYADDLIITANSKDILIKIKSMLEEFLKVRGLELSEEKTKISHINDGFDFLGWNFRKYNGKLLVKPSKKSITAVYDKVSNLIEKGKAWNQDNLIRKINVVLRGWGNYHSHAVSKEIFSKLDHLIWQKLYRWAKRRHPNKSKQWIKERYWSKIGNRDWIFDSDNVRLMLLSNIPIKRHRMPKLGMNPYLDSEYFTKRSTKVSTRMKLSDFPLFELPDTERV